MATEGIGVDGLVTIAGSHSGTAVIVVDTAGRNQIAVASGANMHLTVDALLLRISPGPSGDVPA
jgi:sugar/nucleoside kinase (ribokinase family)